MVREKISDIMWLNRLADSKITFAISRSIQYRRTMYGLRRQTLRWFELGWVGRVETRQEIGIMRRTGQVDVSQCHIFRHRTTVIWQSDFSVTGCSLICWVVRHFITKWIWILIQGRVATDVLTVATSVTCKKY